VKRPNTKLIRLLRDNSLTIAFAESMTCGLLAHLLSSVSGSAGVLQGSIVCYDEDVKITLLRIKPSLIQKHSAESRKVTDAMAKKLRQIIPADNHGANTGLAAGGGSDSRSKPVGTVFFSFYYQDSLYTLKKRYYGTPRKIQEKACWDFYEIIYRAVKESLPVMRIAQN
jgi:nicotinamide-nucleotide amidase